MRMKGILLIIQHMWVLEHAEDGIYSTRRIFISFSLEVALEKVPTT